MSVTPKIFISYSRHDRRALERLRTHLKPLVRDDEIDLWDDSRIQAGDVWKAEIGQALASINAAVLLVSADFLASDFIHENELPPIFTAWVQRGIRIYWVLLSPCDLGHYQSLLQLQAVNSVSKPLSEMSRDQKERVWTKLVGWVTNDIKAFSKPCETSFVPQIPSGMIARNQVETLKKAVAYVYRARNLSRSLSQMPLESSGDTSDLRQLRDIQADLADLLYEERAILSDTVFIILHALKYSLFDLISEIDTVRRPGPTECKPLKASQAAIREHYQKLDNSYVNLLRIIQKLLGIEE